MKSYLVMGSSSGTDDFYVICLCLAQNIQKAKSIGYHMDGLCPYTELKAVRADGLEGVLNELKEQHNGDYAINLAHATEHERDALNASGRCVINKEEFYLV